MPVAIHTDGRTIGVAWDVNGTIAFSASVDGGGTWFPAPVRVDHSTACPGAPITPSGLRVIADGAAVYVAWGATIHCSPFLTFYGAFFNRSLDGGQTWLPVDVPLSGVPSPVPVGDVDLAFDGAGLHAVWKDNRDGVGNIYVTRSLDGGTTWLAPQRVERDPWPGAESARPHIAASAGAVHVAWMDYRNGAADVYCNSSYDAGATWSATDVRLATGRPAGSTWVNDIRIAADGGTVCVAWRDHRSWTGTFATQADIHANRSLDGGLTWLPTDVRVGPGAAAGAVECLELDLALVGSAAHLVWRDLRNGGWDAYTARSLDGGATWQTETRLDTSRAPGTGFAGFPVIAATPTVVAAAWLEGPPPADVHTNRSFDGGTTWAVDQLLDTGSHAPGQQSFGPTLAAHGDLVRVVWRDGNDVVSNLPFGFVDYGTGTAGSGSVVPRLTGTGLAAPGNSFAVQVESGLGGTVGGMLVGLGPASRIALPMLGGTILVQPAFSFVLVLTGAGAGNGTAQVPVAVPPSGAFVGQNLDFQVLLLDAFQPSGVTLTNALEVWIG
ncbi:MAG: exo-alpha-sialidase [Planctomycetes bacterium]|nr:exo-alpha-sialidase [Planctomycetota bacterium]